MAPELVGVYWFACSLMYSTGGPIAVDDDRWGYLRVRSDRLKSLLSQLEVRKKLTISDGQVWQNRVGTELERAKKRVSSAQENGLRGGRPKENNDLDQPFGISSGYADEKLTNNRQQPSINTHSPLPDRKGQISSPDPVYTPEFEAIWQRMPKKVDKADTFALFTRRVKSDGIELINSRVVRWAELCRGKEQKYIPSPAKWFRGRKWEDEGYLPTKPEDQRQLDHAFARKAL